MSTMSSRMGSNGIQKRTGGGRPTRIDQDGDLDMDAPSKMGGRGARRGGGRSININSAPKGPAADRTGASGSGVTRSRGGRSRGGTRKGRQIDQSMIGIKVCGWKQSKGSAEECVRFLERKTNMKFRKTSKHGDTLVIYIPPARLQAVLDWDKAKFAGVNLRITADVITDLFNTTMAAATPQNSNTTATIGILEQVLEVRYKPETRLLDLSNLGEEPLLKANGFFELNSTTSKMFPALMAVADKKFASQQAKRDAVVSVSLANNSLSSISPVTTLSLTFPDIRNLTLEGNRIADMKSMEGWKNRFRFLEVLIMTGNPIVDLPDYRHEMIRRYPRLTLLDNTLVDRPKIEPVAGGPSQNPSTSVDAKGRPILPLPTKSDLTVDMNGWVMNFLAKYYVSYDNSKDVVIKYCYTAESKFSLSVNTSAPRVEAQQGERQFWDDYIPKSRNMKRLQDTSEIISRVAVGPSEIFELWNSLPAVKHDMSNIAAWCFDIFPVEVAPGVEGVFVCVHGEFEEENKTSGKVIKRSFDRTFMLHVAGPEAIKVVSDMLVIRSYSGLAGVKVESVPTVEPTPETPVPKYEPTPEEKQTKITQLAETAGLTEKAAEDALVHSDWDLENSWDRYVYCHTRRMLPAECYSGKPAKVVVEQFPIGYVEPAAGTAQTSVPQGGAPQAAI